MKGADLKAALACVILLVGMAWALPAQDVVVRSNHNVVLRAEADTVAVLRKGRAAGFRPSVLIGRVVTFRLTLPQMNAFADSMRAWPEIGRDREGRLMVEWDTEFTLPPDTTQMAGAGPLELAPEWHVRAVHADQAWALGYTGQGVMTAALDAAGGWGHSGVNIAGGWNATSGDSANGYQNDPNCNSHGIHTASSMSGTRASRVGVAPGSSVLLVRVFQLTGACVAFNSIAIQGANYAANRGARLLNVSIGFPTYSYSGMAAAAALKARGVMFCGSNGNESTTPTAWPAADSNAVGSAAIDASGNRAGFSNYGPSTDFGSPGVGVNGAMQGGGYGSKSGTSMASPVTCGAFAVLMSAYPSATLDELVVAMKATADSLPGARPNDYTGWGRPNVASAIAYLAPNRVKTEWLTKTYPAGPVTDSVMVACANTCRVTLPNGATIRQPTGWVHFTATANATMIVRDTGGVAAPPPPPPPPPPAALAVTVDAAQTFQTIDGFGTTTRLFDDPHFTNTFDPATRKSAVLIPAAAQNSMMRAAYVDLGLTRVRYATDPGFEVANDNADPNVVNEAGFNYWFKLLDGHTDYVAAARALGVTMWWGSPILPESWMDRSDVPEYVENTMQILRRWRARGQALPLWAIANEPEFAGGRSPEFHRLAIRALGAAMAAEGMTTRIVLSDASYPTGALPIVQAVMADAVARQYVAAIGVHLYPGAGTPNLPAYTDLAALSTLATQYGVPLWMTEWSNPDYLRWAITMHELLATYRVSAIDYMWPVFGQWETYRAALMVMTYSGTTYTGFFKQPVYGVMRQYSRYVRPGMVRVGATAPTGVLATAYRGAGQVVVVLVNSGAAQTVSVACAVCGAFVGADRSSATEIGVAVSNCAAFTLPAGSVTTLRYVGP